MSAASAQDSGKLSPAVAAEINKYKQELQNIAVKIGDLETEADEHGLVIDTMKPMSGDRKCFRLINGVLVERTVKEVLPALEVNKKGIKDVIEKLLEEYKKKETAFKEFQKKNGIQQTNSANIFGIDTAWVGAGLAVLRQGARRGAELARRQLLVSMEIPSKDKSYQWMLIWISQQNQINSRKLASMSQQTSWLQKSILKAAMPRQLAVETSFKQHDNGSVSTNFNLVPGQGKHIFNYKGRWIQIERLRETKMVDFTTGSPWETITMTTLSRDRDVFDDILTKAREFALAQQVGKTVLYTSFGPEWRPFGLPRKRRCLDSVILDDNVSQTILNDVHDFTRNGQWYDERGIPYRRGYLLYGPPGSGKTSFIQALAGELEYNICILNLSERGLTDDRLNHLLTVAPERSIMLLEDIDAAFTKERDQSEKAGYQQSMVTFSGLLNALDGVASSEERLIFMTTNHIERLDPALIRPGRVDMKVFLGNATPSQMRRMFTRFYPCDEQLAESFVDKIRDKSISTAHLQGHFVFYKHSAKAAVDNTDSLLTQNYKSG
ncbi:Complex III assembly protein translocase and chaperone [Mycoemilia scoparia]|uniref:Complex III assembly protein translocase and chaperone n=1 Tax=Mycoemilia scoparia TaxID=417184 RepID=A0A9W8A2K5_9FUNG|nr:Complex III assembly protein translocase and chaperone [Mycoemilia scoparia]